MDEATVRMGLLLEAAQTQQNFAQGALERLREQAAGLDAVVREEIHHSLLEALRALTLDSERAAAALRRLQRVAGVRQLFINCAALLVSGAALGLVARELLPTPSELAVLSARRDELRLDVARLVSDGAQTQLRRCGVAHRLCVRVDRTAPRYGADGDFLVIKGY